MKQFLFIPWAAVLLLWLVGCNEDTTQQAADAEEIAKLQKTNANLEREVKLLREDFEAKYNELLKQNEELLKSADDLKSQVEQAQDDADKAKKELEEYQAKYKLSVREKAKGLEIPELTTADAKKFQSVVVTEVTPVMLSFRHQGGVARVRIETLPSNLQQQFLYDPEEAKAVEEAAAQTAAADPEKAAEETQPEEVEIPPEVARAVDPMIIKRYNDRIAQRRAAMAKIEREAKRVQEGPYSHTALTRLRLKVLGQRYARLQEDIRELKNQLYRAAQQNQ